MFWLPSFLEVHIYLLSSYFGLCFLRLSYYFRPSFLRLSSFLWSGLIYLGPSSLCVWHWSVEIKAAKLGNHI